MNQPKLKPVTDVAESFETMLTGGHPNSLGRTIEVVDIVFANPERLIDLYNCYFSEDEVVRLRTSNGMRRVCQEQPEWVVPYIDRLIEVISKIDQASTQWTLAILFDMLKGYMSAEQQTSAQAIMQRNLANHNDWIVLNNSMQVLTDWSEHDADLQTWLRPHLDRLSYDSRKSVAKRATKYLAKLDS
ncbi:MAG: hypothetical protein AAF902_14675 [Chloroflexota bacterium]